MVHQLTNLPTQRYTPLYKSVQLLQLQKLLLRMRYVGHYLEIRRRVSLPTLLALTINIM